MLADFLSVSVLIEFALKLCVLYVLKITSYCYLFFFLYPEAIGVSFITMNFIEMTVFVVATLADFPPSFSRVAKAHDIFRLCDSAVTPTSNSIPSA